jgi:hypothetical protein
MMRVSYAVLTINNFQYKQTADEIQRENVSDVGCASVGIGSFTLGLCLIKYSLPD